MVGLVLCGVAFVAVLLFAWRSMTSGIVALLFTGYLYGIVRANYPDTFSHFIFDSGVLGLYFAVFARNWPRAENEPQRDLYRWLGILIGWACVMFLLPLQDPRIQLVGLRGNAFLIPCMLIGARLRDSDARNLALALACLNLMALAFGGAEYFLGVPRFYPENPVTELIYRSKDLDNFTAFRIPATFNNAHVYAGTMALSLPWLVGTWTQPGCPGWRRTLLMAGTGAALIGIFMAGARVFVVQLGCLLLAATFSGKMSQFMWIGWAIMLGCVGYMVRSAERLQRFFTLVRTEEVLERINGSVNRSFLELLTTYPMGNGLGGGGTSIPHFMQSLIKDPVIMENEYCRIMMEQGVIGLVLWICFMVWVLMRPKPPSNHPWSLGWQLLWVITLTSFVAAVLGTGMMTSIPQTCLLFLGVGFLAVPRAPLKIKRRVRPQQPGSAASASGLAEAITARGKP
jgi:hypothetical protein